MIAGKKNQNGQLRRFFYFCLLVLAAFAFRLFRLGKASLWYDETVSAYLANLPVEKLINHTALDIHPPGYYLLLHYWTKFAGSSEFALAYFSLIFGLLLLPLLFLIGKKLLGSQAAGWGCLLLTFSPFQLWYSQEVRMYALAAVLGLLAFWGLWKAKEAQTPRELWPSYGLYVLASTAGLYVLYYLGFLLIVLNVLFLADRIIGSRQKAAANRQSPVYWLMAQGSVILLYLPWLAIAWRQATQPPVPPWRQFIPLPEMLGAGLSALVQSEAIKPNTSAAIISIVLFLIFGVMGSFARPRKYSLPAWIWAVAYFLGPILLIYLFSLRSPLFHPRYVFPFSPLFYLWVGGGIAWLWQRRRAGACLGVMALLAVAAPGIVSFHFDRENQPDDLRAAIEYLDKQWAPGDVLLFNAGYTYTAYLYYHQGAPPRLMRLVDFSPTAELVGHAQEAPLVLMTGAIDGAKTLGFNNPQSDFYSTSAEETRAALDRAAQAFPRLWEFRLYDTVVDSQGVIRRWLNTETTPIDDQAFTGSSYLRVMGFASKQPPSPENEEHVELANGLALTGFNPPRLRGRELYATTWWAANKPQAVDYKLSLKLWRPDGSLAAQGEDFYPCGPLLTTSRWEVGKVQYQPLHMTLPGQLPPETYWLNVELYDPQTIQPVARTDTGEKSISLGPVIIPPAGQSSQE
jgi:hypothetical protein